MLKYLIIILKKTSDLNRPSKRLIQILFDSLLFYLFIFISLYIVTNDLEPLMQINVLLVSFVSLSISLMVLSISGFYKNIIRHASTGLLTSSIKGAFSSFIVFYLYSFSNSFFSLNVLILFSILFFNSLFLSRLFVKNLYSNLNSNKKKNVVIYGAGKVGRQILTSLRNTNDYKVLMFLDDNPDFQGYKIDDIKIYSFEYGKQLLNNKDVDVLLIAMPSITKTARNNILTQINKFSIQVKIIPGIEEVLQGKFVFEKLQSVTINELLERKQIQPKMDLMSLKIYNKEVLVTGAGGSIGSEICRQIIPLKPKKLIILDNSEISLFKINRELVNLVSVNRHNLKIIPILCSIQHQKQLEKIFEQNKIETLFHAAAYKHVPLVEQNPFEAIYNNVFGTKILSEVAIASQVKTFILISSDKAVRPTNVMGATKRFSEIICLSEKTNNKQTRFSAVRFGNVLASSGSVIPIFQNQIKNGGPVTVTHKEVTRYFMTISEAAQLVIQTAGMAGKRGVFLLDMGNPVKIMDLAIKMIRLQGLVPFINDKNIVQKGDIEISIVGLRPGEKLYEELLIHNKANSTAHPRIMLEKPGVIDKKKFQKLLVRLEKACEKNDFNSIIDIFNESEIGFKHTLNNFKISKK